MMALQRQNMRCTGLALVAVPSNEMYIEVEVEERVKVAGLKLRHDALMYTSP
jgi:hypothetical protein